MIAPAYFVVALPASLAAAVSTRVVVIAPLGLLGSGLVLV